MPRCENAEMNEQGGQQHMPGQPALGRFALEEHQRPNSSETMPANSDPVARELISR